MQLGVAIPRARNGGDCGDALQAISPELLQADADCTDGTARRDHHPASHAGGDCSSFFSMKPMMSWIVARPATCSGAIESSWNSSSKAMNNVIRCSESIFRSLLKEVVNLMSSSFKLVTSEMTLITRCCTLTFIGG